MTSTFLCQTSGVTSNGIINHNGIPRLLVGGFVPPTKPMEFTNESPTSPAEARCILRPIKGLWVSPGSLTHPEINWLMIFNLRPKPRPLDSLRPLVFPKDQCSKVYHGLPCPSRLCRHPWQIFAISHDLTHNGRELGEPPTNCLKSETVDEGISHIFLVLKNSHPRIQDNTVIFQVVCQRKQVDPMSIHQETRNRSKRHPCPSLFESPLSSHNLC